MEDAQQESRHEAPYIAIVYVQELCRLLKAHQDRWTIDDNAARAVRTELLHASQDVTRAKTFAVYLPLYGMGRLASHMRQCLARLGGRSRRPERMFTTMRYDAERHGTRTQWQTRVDETRADLRRYIRILAAARSLSLPA